MFLQLHVGSSASNVTCDPPLEGVPVGSQHPSLCSGVNTKFVPNNEVMCCFSVFAEPDSS